MVVASGDPAVMLRFIRLFFFGDACFPAPGRLRSRRRDDAVASLPGTSSKPVGFVTSAMGTDDPTGWYVFVPAKRAVKHAPGVGKVNDS